MNNKEQILDWIEAQIADINWELQKIEGRREQLFQMKQKIRGMQWEQSK